MLGFLSNLGGMFAKAGKAIGGGVQKGVGQLGKLGQMGDGAERPSQLPRPGGIFRTPDFNPNAGGGGGSFTDRLSGPAAKILDKAGIGGEGISFRPSFSPMQGVNLSGNVPLSGGSPSFKVDTNLNLGPGLSIKGAETFGGKREMPPLTGTYTPTDAPDRMGGFPTGLPTPGRSSVGLSPAAPPAMNPPSRMPGAELRRSDLPIPQLPGRKGETRPYDPITAAEYDFVSERPQRHWKTSLQSALAGAAQGFQQTGDLGGALGGALGGGVGGTVDPVEGRRQIFQHAKMPQMQAETQRQQQYEDRQRKTETDALNQQILRGRARQMDAELEDMPAQRAAQRRRWEADAAYDEARAKQVALPRPQSPRPVQGVVDGVPGWYDFNDPALKGRIQPYSKPERDRPMSIRDAEDEEAMDEGTVEEIAQSSFEGRGGREYLIKQMPPQYQYALKNPTTPDFSTLPAEYQAILNNPPADTSDAAKTALLTKAEQARNQMIQQHQQMVIAAQNELQQMEQRALAEDRRITAAERRKKAGARRTGGTSRGQSGGASTGPTAKLSDLKKYLQ